MVPAKVEGMEFPIVNVLVPAALFVMAPLPDNAMVVRFNVFRSIVPDVRSRVPLIAVFAFNVVVPDAIVTLVSAPVPEML